MTICGFSGMDEYIRLARRGSGGEFGENAHFCKLLFAFFTFQDFFAVFLRLT
jgi:hypothetical protein